MNTATMKMSPNPATSSGLGYELVRAKEIINEFVYSCSHSMRGPLKSMSGLINLVRQSIVTGNEDPQIYLALMTESVGRMETLLQQFEDFLENSKKDLKHEPVDVQFIVRSILSEVQADIDRHGLRITVNVDQS